MYAMQKQVIVALDGMSLPRALRIASVLSGSVWGFKVNDLLFDDPRIIRRLKRYGNVFADAKLHDIPNTVANSTRKLAALGADIITVHASGGVAMMHAAKRAASKRKVIAVTVLTSDADDKKRLRKLASAAIAAGVDGIVCAGGDLPTVKKIDKAGRLLVVVPGIRRDREKKDDQKRTMSARDAFGAGANYIVVGRPVTRSRDPRRALSLILHKN